MMIHSVHVVEKKGFPSQNTGFVNGKRFINGKTKNYCKIAEKEKDILKEVQKIRNLSEVESS